MTTRSTCSASTAWAASSAPSAPASSSLRLGGAGIVDYANGGATIYSGHPRASHCSGSKGVGVTIVWSGVGSAMVWFIVKLLTGGRVKDEIEEEGLDLNEHGEVAYHS
jgi:Amt family ammonium transporter